MARETRVGLLIGLAFIICFAVILANRGRQDLVASQLPHDFLLHQGSISPPHGGASASLDARPLDQHAGGGSSNHVVPSQHPGPGSVAAARPDRRTGAPDADLDARLPDAELQLEPAVSTSVFRTGVAAADVLTQSDGPGQGSAPGAPAATSPATAVDDARFAKQKLALQALLDQLPKPRHGQQAEGGPAAVPAVSPGGRATPGAHHVVGAGDTLSRIAVRYYGENSKKFVDAIYQANRSVLTSADQLRIGDVLILPDIAAASRQPESAGRETDPTPSPATVEQATTSKASAASSSFRWYQVRKQDRLYGIARDELGDASRWQEIFELNKDKFPDPNRIREGVRIKIPTGRGSAGKR